MHSYKDYTNTILISITTLSIAICIAILTHIFLYCTTKIRDSSLSPIEHKVASTISQICDDSDNITITFCHQDKEWVYSSRDFTINTDIHTILDSMHLHSEKTKDYITTIHTIDDMLNSGNSYYSILNYIFLGLKDRVLDMVHEIEYDAIDSTIHFTGNKDNLFNITNSYNGNKVNIDTLYTTLGNKIMESNNVKINVPTIDILPSITKEYNTSLTKKIATFTTNVSDSTGGRKTNVKLALSKINGLTVQPNETVSFNKITGPHTADTGYKPATVIYNNEYVEDIGGGICQASSTLYNALLLTGIRIDEVNKHSLPVKYVPLALDAMVSEGISDLRFTNTTKYPIYIHTYSDSESVSVDIYSRKNDEGITYKTRSETIREIESTKDKIVPDDELKYTSKVLFKGEYYRLKYPKNGYEAIGILETYKDGILIDEKKMRHEIYKPQDGVVIEGIANPVENMVVIDNGVVICE